MKNTGEIFQIVSERANLHPMVKSFLINYFMDHIRNNSALANQEPRFLSGPLHGAQTIEKEALKFRIRDSRLFRYHTSDYIY